MTETIAQLQIDECKDIKDQDCTIRYAVYNKLEFLINNSKISFECFPDVNILTKIKRATGMDLIKTTRILRGIVVDNAGIMVW
jgi:hypothetical protein